MRRSSFGLAGAAVLALLACGQPAPNPVARFLEGAECQFETLDQKQVIDQALSDLLTLPAAAAKERRYRDYRMNDGAWTALEVITHHFVPASPVAPPSPETFYADVADPAARRVLESQLRDLRAAPGKE